MWPPGLSFPTSELDNCTCWETTAQICETFLERLQPRATGADLCAGLSARRGRDVLSTSSLSPSRSVVAVLRCTAWRRSVPSIAVCVAALRSACVCRERKLATRTSIQALTGLIYDLLSMLARLSGDLARPIFIPPPPPPYVEHRALIDMDKRVEKRFSVTAAGHFN